MITGLTGGSATALTAIQSQLQDGSCLLTGGALTSLTGGSSAALTGGSSAALTGGTSAGSGKRQTRGSCSRYQSSSAVIRTRCFDSKLYRSRILFCHDIG